MREFNTRETYEYVRWDNAGDFHDPLLRAQWRLKIKEPFPERWGVLIGDVVTNLRAALDHAFWAAAVLHSGPPENPRELEFPIYATNRSSYTKRAKKLQSLVAPDVWSIVDAMQPFHGGDCAHTSPLEILRYLSNVDKHRFIHVVGRTYIDLTPVKVRSEPPLDIIEEKRYEGPAEDNQAVLLLKLKRPSGNATIELVPTFAFSATIQTSEKPEDFRTLYSVMEAMTDNVLEVLSYTTVAAGLPMPASDSVDVGEEHDTVAAEYGGHSFTYREHDGTSHHFRLPVGDLDQDDR